MCFIFSSRCTAPGQDVINWLLLLHSLLWQAIHASTSNRGGAYHDPDKENGSREEKLRLVWDETGGKSNDIKGTHIMRGSLCIGVVYWAESGTKQGQPPAGVPASFTLSFRTRRRNCDDWGGDFLGRIMTGLDWPAESCIAILSVPYRALGLIGTLREVGLGIAGPQKRELTKRNSPLKSMPCGTDAVVTGAPSAAEQLTASSSLVGIGFRVISRFVQERGV